MKPLNSCPTCGNKPDIPDNLAIVFYSSSKWFFCNYCGVKLGCNLDISLPLPHRPGIHSLAFLVSEIPPKSLRITVWKSPIHKIFVSYSHKDDFWCVPFSELLKTKGYDVFMDNGSIGKGADWVESIGQAIEACHYFIIVLTPDAWASDWVQRELNTAFAARREIIPVLLKDTKVEGLLRAVQWVDARGKTAEEASSLVKAALKQKP